MLSRQQLPAVTMPGDDKVALSIEELYHRFGRRRHEVQVLSGVSFAVRAGTVAGLLGPNGAGKTTLFELVCGLRPVQQGNVMLFPERLRAGEPRTRHRVGFLPQKSALYEEVTVGDNLRFASDLHRCGRKRVDEVLHLVGLSEQRHSLISSLSGGMQRRVAIARALLHEPELLLLDEPTLGVDSDHRHRIWQHVRDMKRTGATVVLSSHHLDEVEALCDQVIVLDAGRTIADARPAELFRRAGWWVEVEAAHGAFHLLEKACRGQGATDIMVEAPTVRMRFPDAGDARRSMNELVSSGLVSGIRERRPDLVEVFTAVRNGE